MTLTKEDICKVLRLLGFSFRCKCCNKHLSKPESIVRKFGSKCAEEECACYQA